MKKKDVFPSKYLVAADLEGRARVLTIKSAPYELLKNRGKEERKTALYFEEIQKGFPLNVTNWSSVCSVTREDDTDRWPGKQIEVYPDKTPMDGQMVDCIRVRAPRPRRKETAPPAPQPQLRPALAAPSEQIDDEVLFEWEQEDRSGA